MAVAAGSTDSPVYLVMGVCGTGKTTIAHELASRLGLAVHDADDFHSAANRVKMQAGTPLDDHDRGPWLDMLSAEAAGWARLGGALLACSALKRSYRAKLRASCPSLVTIFLDVPAVDVLRERLASRTDHFMPASLIESQLATLEPQHGQTLSVCLARQTDRQRSAQPRPRTTVGVVCPLAAPQLGSCVTLGRIWRRRAVPALPGGAGPLLPWVLEPAASEAADSTAFDHSGAALGGGGRARTRAS